MNECYSVSIEGSADASRDLTRELLGRRATLVMHLAERPEVIHGVIHAVALVGHSGTESEPRATYSIELGPRLWLLKKRRRSRVFQNKRVDEIVKAVLESAHIPMLWTLQGELPVREYCTQYEETDEEFVRRILAEAGILFYFLQPALPPALAEAASLVETLLGALRAIPALGDLLGSLGVGSITGEVMLFADDPTAYYGIGDLPEGLEGLIQAALGRAGSELAAATGPAGAAVTSVVRDLGALGLSAAKTSRTLRYTGASDAVVAGDRDIVRSFSIRHSVESDGAVFTTFDPRRPMSPLTFVAHGDGGATRVASRLRGLVPEQASSLLGSVMPVANTAVGIARDLGANTGAVDGVLDGVGAVAGAPRRSSAEMVVTESHDPFLFPDFAYAESEPRRILDAERRERRLGKGESLCPTLSSGHRFTLEGHPVEWVNREYVVTEVVHEGRAFDGLDSTGAVSVYKNSFACVPSDVLFPPRKPRRRTIQTCLTATVIAPAHDAEIETREMGEIKVRFHWEEGALGTCWIRTMQAWSGVGWGSQFLPRRGMEVVVGFDGGDPDRPIVLGCVYNATHPAPFTLPQNQTKSGIRTQSSPNATGFNELSFEDRHGQERVYVHAERDLDVHVKHDRVSTVLHDDGLLVENEQRLRVYGLQESHFQGGQQIVARGHRSVEVEGTDQHVTRGQHQLSVHGPSHTEINGERRASISGTDSVTVGGDSHRETRGSASELVRRTRTVRVEGRSELSSARTQVIHSDSEIVLHCGDSTLRVAADCIELSAGQIRLAAGGSRITLSSDGITESTDAEWSATGSSAELSGASARVRVDTQATIQGAQVQLRSGGGSATSQKPTERQMTVIELKDERGRPVPRERYRIEFADGTARTGHLDEDGRAELDLDQSGDVVFPDLPEVTQS
ncbi:MAG: type VI secretion system tip protein TssI/VgrG [Polyangiaceae bacterium]